MGISWEVLNQRQPIAVKMLQNSVRKNRVAHAYLFEGPKGTGKMDMAVYYAKVLLCDHLNDVTPCGNCRNCKRVESGNHPNVYILRPEELSIKKHQIQELQEEFSKTAVENNRKIYLIEHADTMTASAANSLLKFLEEPVSLTTAILVTEQLQRILPTIVSRCQNVHFQPLSVKNFENQLQAQEIPSDLALLLARITNNEKEASELAKEEWFAQARSLVIELYEALISLRKDSLLLLQQGFVRTFETKERLQLGLDLLILVFKDMIYIHAEQEQNIVFKEIEQALKHASNRFSLAKITNCLTIILEAKKRLVSNANMLLVAEQMIIELQEGL